MKKRFLILFLTLLLLLPCLAAAVSGEEAPSVAFSQDFLTLQYKGVTYTRVNTAFTQWDTQESFFYIDCPREEVSYIDFFVGNNRALLLAEIHFIDGSVLTSSYIHPSYAQEHTSLLNTGGVCTIDFSYPDGNVVSTTLESLLGDPTRLPNYSAHASDWFDVTVKNRDNSYSLQKGFVLKISGTYYYVDYISSGCRNPAEISPWEAEGISAYVITDPDLVGQLKNAFARYNSMGLYSEEFVRAIAIVFLFISYGALPLASFIVFLILALRAKNPAYKKIFTAIYSTAAATFILFIILAMIVSSFGR